MQMGVVEVLNVYGLEVPYAGRSVKYHVIVPESHKVQVPDHVVDKCFVVGSYNNVIDRVGVHQALQVVYYVASLEDSVIDCIVLHSRCGQLGGQGGWSGVVLSEQNELVSGLALFRYPGNDLRQLHVR